MAISRKRRAQIERDGATETKFEDTGIRYSTKNLKKDQIRLVPVPENMKLFKRIGTHFVFGKPFTCPRVTHGESCPLCELRSELRNSDDKEEKKLSESIKVSIRYALRVISRKDQEENNNIPSRVFIFESPKAIFDVVYSTMTGLDPNDEDSEPDWAEALDLTDPIHGFDVVITKSGKTWNETKYGAKIKTKKGAPHSSKLHSSKEVRIKLKKEAKKLDLTEWATHDQDLDEVVRKIIEGESFDDDDGKKRKKKRKNRSDDYDEDIPRKKKKKKDKKKKKKKKGTLDELESKMSSKKRKRKKKK